MPLFTDPVTINDGAADRSFSFRAQIADSKSIVGEWIEPAAALSASSKFVVKHDETKTDVRRRLLQRVENAAILDETLRPITVNFTVTHHPEHTEAQITAEVTLALNALGIATTLPALLDGLI